MCYTEWKQQLKTVELQAFPPPPPSSPHQSVCHEVTSAHSCSWPRVGPWVGSNVEESLSLPACGFLLSQVQPWWNLPVGQTTSSPVLVQPRHCRICFFPTTTAFYPAYTQCFHFTLCHPFTPPTLGSLFRFHFVSATVKQAKRFLRSLYSHKGAFSSLIEVGGKKKRLFCKDLISCCSWLSPSDLDPPSRMLS